MIEEVKHVQHEQKCFIHFHIQILRSKIFMRRYFIGDTVTSKTSRWTEKRGLRAVSDQMFVWHSMCTEASLQYYDKIDVN